MSARDLAGQDLNAANAKAAADAAAAAQVSQDRANHQRLAAEAEAKDAILQQLLIAADPGTNPQRGGTQPVSRAKLIAYAYTVWYAEHQKEDKQAQAQAAQAKDRIQHLQESQRNSVALIQKVFDKNAQHSAYFDTVTNDLVNAGASDVDSAASYAQSAGTLQADGTYIARGRAAAFNNYTTALNGGTPLFQVTVPNLNSGNAPTAAPVTAQPAPANLTGLQCLNGMDGNACATDEQAKRAANEGVAFFNNNDSTIKRNSATYKALEQRFEGQIKGFNGNFATLKAINITGFEDGKGNESQQKQLSHQRALAEQAVLIDAAQKAGLTDDQLKDFRAKIHIVDQGQQGLDASQKGHADSRVRRSQTVFDIQAH